MRSKESKGSKEKNNRPFPTRKRSRSEKHRRVISSSSIIVNLSSSLFLSSTLSPHSLCFFALHSFTQPPRLPTDSPDLHLNPSPSTPAVPPSRNPPTRQPSSHAHSRHSSGKPSAGSSLGASLVDLWWLLLHQSAKLACFSRPRCHPYVFLASSQLPPSPFVVLDIDRIAPPSQTYNAYLEKTTQSQRQPNRTIGPNQNK